MHGSAAAAGPENDGLVRIHSFIHSLARSLAQAALAAVEFSIYRNLLPHACIDLVYS
jgi:hypothetical protein